MTTSLTLAADVQLDFTIDPAAVVVRLGPNRCPPPAIVQASASVPGVEVRVLDAHSFEVVLRKPGVALDGHYVLVQTAGAVVAVAHGAAAAPAGGRAVMALGPPARRGQEGGLTCGVV